MYFHDVCFRIDLAYRWLSDYWNPNLSRLLQSSRWHNHWLDASRTVNPKEEKHVKTAHKFPLPQELRQGSGNSKSDCSQAKWSYVLGRDRRSCEHDYWQANWRSDSSNRQLKYRNDPHNWLIDVWFQVSRCSCNLCRVISLRAIINFDPSEARLKASALTLKLLLRLVDKISVLRFTPTIRTKLMKNRQNMEK